MPCVRQTAMPSPISPTLRTINRRQKRTNQEIKNAKIPKLERRKIQPAEKMEMQKKDKYAGSPEDNNILR